MEDTVKMTLYVSPELKEKVKDMAKESAIQTSTSNFAAYLLKLGIAMHNGDDAFVQREEIVGPK